MKTFTIDSRNGELNPDIRWIETETREELREVINNYIKKCIENDVEMTSSEGLFFDMVIQELSMARMKQVYEIVKREKKNINE